MRYVPTPPHLAISTTPSCHWLTTPNNSAGCTHSVQRDRQYLALCTHKYVDQIVHQIHQIIYQICVITRYTSTLRVQPKAVMTMIEPLGTHHSNTTNSTLPVTFVIMAREPGQTTRQHLHPVAPHKTCRWRLASGGFTLGLAMTLAAWWLSSPVQWWMTTLLREPPLVSPVQEETCC